MAMQIAVADAAIPRQVGFVHTSGALGLDALRPVSGRHPVGSFHPLRSFPRPSPPAVFRGIFIAVDASTTPLLSRLKVLARTVGAKPRRVTDGQRIIYHAAAVFASNYVVALLDLAVGLLEEIGWGAEDAGAALMPLAEGALADVAHRGTVHALTGPISRGDLETVTRHLAALAVVGAGRTPQGGPRPLDVYRMLGQIALEIAKEAGLEPAAAEPIRKALTRNMAATRRRGHK